MNSHFYIACDLGAESGRVILGILQEGQLTLNEMHRFPNDPVQADGSLRWDVTRVFDELKIGLGRVAAHLEEAGTGRAESMSVDSWGVDYVLLRGPDALALPYHYRDSRTEATFPAAFETVSAQTVFAETGIQIMPINTLYQLLAHRQEAPEELAQADQFLLIADYFNALFSGVAVAERSLASTTQLYNPCRRASGQRKCCPALHLSEHCSRALWTPGRRWGRCGRKSRRKPVCSEVQVDRDLLP